MFTEGDDFVSFDNTDEDLTEVLRRFGILDRINTLPDLVERENVKQNIIDELRKSLDNIQELPLNTSGGEPSAVFKGRYFNIRKIVFSALEVGANVLVVALLPPLSLALTGVSLLPSAISTISKVNEFAKKLGDSELAVYKAVKEANEKKNAQARVLREAGVNREEIESYFEALDEEAPNLEAALGMLAKAGIVNERLGTDGKTTYYEIPRF